MQLRRLLKVSTKTSLSKRTIVYLSVAVFAQIFYWYFGTPSLKSIPAVEPSLGRAVSACFVSVGWLFLLPVICVVVMRDDLSRFGIGLGDYRFGIKAFLILCPLVALVPMLGLLNPNVQDYYPLSGSSIGHDLGAMATWCISYACFYFAFEFFYRAYLLYGTDELGMLNCILVSVICCILIHLGKPFGEALASIPAAIVFTAVAVRSRSIWYGVALHIVLGVTNDIVTLWNRGELSLFG